MFQITEASLYITQVDKSFTTPPSHGHSHYVTIDDGNNAKFHWNAQNMGRICISFYFIHDPVNEGLLQVNLLLWLVARQSQLMFSMTLLQ